MIFLNKSDTKTLIVNGSGVITKASLQLNFLRKYFLMIARILGDKGIREYLAAAKIVRR